MNRSKPRPPGFYTLSSLLARAERKKGKRGDIPPKMVVYLQMAYAREGWYCEKCGSEQDLTADHVVPKWILGNLGFDTRREFRLEWLQVLCKPCNSKKAGALDWKNWRTIHIIKQALEEKSGLCVKFR